MSTEANYTSEKSRFSIKPPSKSIKIAAETLVLWMDPVKARSNFRWPRISALRTV